MSINFKFYIVICLFFLSVFSNNIFAEPYLAFKTNKQCSACHVNPIGGGARNSFGVYYGSQVLPETLGSIAGDNPGQLSEGFLVGGDLRFNYDQTSRDQTSRDQTNRDQINGNNDSADTKSFNTKSAQIYFSLAPKGSKISLYIDQQIAPGSTLNRETYVLARLKNNHYVKAGKIMLPYGIRLEDDSAFIRQATQINFDNSDNGVELGLGFEKLSLNFALSNGSSTATNNDDKFQATFRGEYLGERWRVGGSAVINDADQARRTMSNIFGGFNWGGLIVLAEVDRISDEQAAGEDDRVQTVSFLEVNKELARGYNLKFTTEYLDPDNDVDEDERTRHSVVFEYTPYAHLQLRAGIRSGEDIPQRDEGNFTDFFMQVHMYY